MEQQQVKIINYLEESINDFQRTHPILYGWHAMHCPHMYPWNTYEV